MKKIYIILCFISCTIFLFGYQSRAAANKTFGNTTYFTSCPYIAEKVTLVNGHRVAWNFRLHVSMHYEGHYVYGDFNYDGLKDAAVIIGESQGGSDDGILLAFLIHSGTELVHKKSAYLGGSAIINSLKERDGKVIVDMFVHQDGDCMAGPTRHVKSIFEYGNGDEIEEKQISAKSLFDPALLVLKDYSSWAYVLERWQAGLK